MRDACWEMFTVAWFGSCVDEWYWVGWFQFMISFHSILCVWVLLLDPFLFLAIVILLLMHLVIFLFLKMVDLWWRCGFILGWSFSWSGSDSCSWYYICPKIGLGAELFRQLCQTKTNFPKRDLEYFDLCPTLTFWKSSYLARDPARVHIVVILIK